MLLLIALCLVIAAVAVAYGVGSSAGYALGVAHGRESEAAEQAVAMLDRRVVIAPPTANGTTSQEIARAVCTELNRSDTFRQLERM